MSLGERLARVEVRLDELSRRADEARKELVKKADEAKDAAEKVATQLHAWRGLVVTSAISLLAVAAVLFLSFRGGGKT